MTRVLMVVHGMGVHGQNWEQGVRDTLATAAADYGLTNELAGIEITPISYDDQFKKWLARWGNDSQALTKYIKQNSIGVPANIVSWLENVDKTEDKFLWSHVVDVLLYRFFSVVSTSVRVQVALQIARRWRDALKQNAGAEVSILAHSLGVDDEDVVHSRAASRSAGVHIAMPLWRRRVL
jgi:hypothetical protein